MKRRNLSFALIALLCLFVALACGRKEEHADEHGHGEGAEESPEGPHGGRLLREGDFAVEVTIFEQGVPPEFRLYAYEDDKPIPPAELTASIDLQRLDRTDRISFQPKGDYLLGDKEIVEPHSFIVNLQAVHEGKNHSFRYEQLEGRVRMTPEQAREAGIAVETVGPAELDNAVALNGEVALNGDRAVHVIARVNGVASSIRKSLGDPVGRGEVLAVIESGEIANLRSDYLAAMRRQQLMKATAEREEELFRKKISSQEEYLRAKNDYEEASIAARSAAERLSSIGISPAAAGQGPLATFAIRSPIAGTVIAKKVNPGESVSAADSLFAVADLSTVWIDVTVPANQLASVRQGQAITVHAPTTGARSEARLSYLGPLIGRESRSAQARAVVPNPNGEWQPGLFVNVHLTTSRTPVPLAVKAEALQKFRDWDVVFIQVGEEYEVRPLELGRRDEEWVEVLGGLAAGQRYVTKNSFLLKADALKAGASHDH